MGELVWYNNWAAREAIYGEERQNRINNDWERTSSIWNFTIMEATPFYIHSLCLFEY